MRLFIPLLLLLFLVMCKSKDTILTEVVFLKTVVLKEEATPKNLVKDISFEISDYKKVNKSINQWTISFQSKKEGNESLMRELLNHPLVISVYDELNGNSSSKNVKKAKVSPIKKNKISKQ